MNHEDPDNHDEGSRESKNVLELARKACQCPTLQNLKYIQNYRHVSKTGLFHLAQPVPEGIPVKRPVKILLVKKCVVERRTATVCTTVDCYTVTLFDILRVC